MCQDDKPGFLYHFDNLEDPRMDRKKLYPLTEKEIARKIREKKADYVLALKGNHSTLHDDIRLFLSAETQKPNSTQITDRCEDFDKGHGRIEHRLCYVSDQFERCI